MAAVSPVTALMIVDEKQLLALPDAWALQLFRSGELHWVSMHLASLSNMQRLGPAGANATRMSWRREPPA